MPALIALGATKVINQLVAGNADNPGDGVGLAAKSRAAAHGLDEGLLRQLLGQLRVAPAAVEQVRVHARKACSYQARNASRRRRRRRLRSDPRWRSTVAPCWPRVAFAG